MKRTIIGITVILLSACSTRDNYKIPEYSGKNIAFEKLPYSLDALSPHISPKALYFHYSKHYLGYVKKADAAIAESSYAGKNVEDIIRSTWMIQEPPYKKIYNNTAQAWNHAFFWKSMAPAKEKVTMPEELQKKVTADFGSVEKFISAFRDAANNHFGSGWVFLAEKDGKLSLLSLSDAGNPIPQGYKPLLALDVWEHSYYLDYQNERAKYTDAFLNHLVNWDFALQNLKL